MARRLVVVLASLALGASILHCVGQDPALVGTPGTADVGVGAVNDGSVGDHAISVTIAGDGKGTVTSVPEGIRCPGTCSQTYASGQSVTLSAVAAADSTFTGWSGGCTGTAACTVTTDTAVAVVATFAKAYAVTVVKLGSGAGIVTSNPSGIDCGPTCSAGFGSGTTITLTAAAGAGSAFGGWAGSCSGVAACTMSMTEAQNVTATFLDVDDAGLACTSVNNATNCTPGTIPEIQINGLDSTACHDQCQIQLKQAGASTGCWILAADTACYCRGGVLNLGGSQSGGTCN